MPTPTFASELTKRIAAFLVSIGIPVLAEPIEQETFLPGILVRDGGLVVDEEKLAHPGDLLHEAGHLAVVPPSRRAELFMHAGNDAGEELMAIAWSWAALLHLGLEPAVLFHPEGYKGGSASLIENFSSGRTFGVPTLQWLGMTAEGARAAELGVPPYPHMIRWLCEERTEEQV